jgi:hypothetical protein
VLIKIYTFWDILLCLLVNTLVNDIREKLAVYDSEDGGNMLLQKFCNCLAVDMSPPIALDLEVCEIIMCKLTM